MKASLSQSVPTGAVSAASTPSLSLSPAAFSPASVSLGALSIVTVYVTLGSSNTMNSQNNEEAPQQLLGARNCLRAGASALFSNLWGQENSKETEACNPDTVKPFTRSQAQARGRSGRRGDGGVCKVPSACQGCAPGSKWPDTTKPASTPDWKVPFQAICCPQVTAGSAGRLGCPLGSPGELLTRKPPDRKAPQPSLTCNPA